MYKNKTIIAPAKGLNETGTVIWQLCDGTKTVQEIIDCLRTIYVGHPEEITNSVLKFFRVMDKHKLIILNGESL